MTLRGTDGLESGTGIMPLSWLTDFGGAMTRSVSDLADMLNVVAGGRSRRSGNAAPADGRSPADWRSVLDINALQGKRIGYIPSVWVDPFGTTGTTDAEKAALQYLEDAGATIVEMGVTVGGTDTPPAPPAPTSTGNIRAEGWLQYIDSHPELLTQGFQIFSEVDVNCSQRKVALRARRTRAPARRRRAPRMTPAEIQTQRDYRRAAPGRLRRRGWTPRAPTVSASTPSSIRDCLSDISLNDGGGGRASLRPPRHAGGRRTAFRRSSSPPDTTITDSRSIIQLLGRAWDDAKLVGMAYAFERYADRRRQWPCRPEDRAGAVRTGRWPSWPPQGRRGQVRRREAVVVE